MSEEPKTTYTLPLMTAYQLGYINKGGIAVPSAYPLKEQSTLTLADVYHYIKTGKAKEATERLREIADHKEAQRFKALSFYTITPAGTFSYRNVKSLLQHSGLMVIDIDGIASHKRLMETKQQLLNDPNIETQMLFVSPSGNGLKWIIYIGPQTAESHSERFGKIKDYLMDRYGIEADKSGRDVSRICYLPYDPDCYINPELL